MQSAGNMLWSRGAAQVWMALISVLLLCVGAPLIHVMPQAGPVWIVLLTGLVSYCALHGEITGEFREYGAISGFHLLILAYVLIVACSGMLHATGLAVLGADVTVNVSGMAAGDALRHVIAFSLLYLLFPLMLLAHLAFLRRLSVETLVRWIVALCVLSALVAVYQAHVAPALLGAWPNRFNGLDVDPNALAMLLFLTLPWMCIGACLESAVWRKLLYVAGLVPCSYALLHTESRTFLLASIVFLAGLPVVIALAANQWRRFTRLALVGTSIALISLPVIFQDHIFRSLLDLGHGGTRLAYSWNKVTKSGIDALFTEGELRGRQYAVAAALIAESPVSGWGAGGYYREYPDMLFRDSGNYPRRGAPDSALNHYLMIAGDLGLSGLALNALLFLSPMLVGSICLFRCRQMRPRLIVYPMLFANLIFLAAINTVPPSYFLSAIWLWSAQLALLVWLAKCHIECPAVFRPMWGRKALMTIMAVLILLLMLGNFKVSFGEYGYQARLAHPWWESVDR